MLHLGYFFRCLYEKRNTDFILNEEGAMHTYTVYITLASYVTLYLQELFFTERENDCYIPIAMKKNSKYLMNNKNLHRFYFSRQFYTVLFSSKWLVFYGIVLFFANQNIEMFGNCQ